MYFLTRNMEQNSSHVLFNCDFLPKSSQGLSQDGLWHPTVMLLFEEGRNSEVFETAL